MTTPATKLAFDGLKAKQHLHATSILNFIANTRKTGKEKRSAGYLKGRLTILNSYWAKFTEYHELISDYATNDFHMNDSYFMDDNFSTIEIDYGESLGFLLDELAVLEKPPPRLNINNTELDCDDGQSSSHLGTAPPRQATVLPRIEVPKFSGDYLEWQSFKDLFTAIIGDNGSLTNVQKLHYLKSGLSGEAARLLCNTQTTDANFVVAWTLLKQRYENKRILVNTHLQTLAKLQPLSKESSTELKELVFTTNQSLTALKNLDRPVDTWDDWIVYGTVQKLDKNSRRDWETKISDSADLPTYDDLCVFLSARIRTLEAIDTSSKSLAVPAPSKPKNVNVHQASTVKCRECKKNHSLISCTKFRQKPVDERRQFVKNEGLCFNCLNEGHSVANCSSKFSCKRCDSKHHTLVHAENAAPFINSYGTDNAAPICSVSTNIAKKQNCYRVLLATAMVMVQSKDGQAVPMRALLDQGSQSSFVSEEAVHLLKLQRFKTNVAISGIAASNGTTAHAHVRLVFSPHHNSNRVFRIDTLVLNRLTNCLPENQFETRHWPHLQNLMLADPKFYVPGKIDIILGADIYGSLLCEGIMASQNGWPMGQNTELGWILSGTVRLASHQISTVSSFHTSVSTDEHLDQILGRFWELENIPEQRYLTDEERACESHFVATHRRDQTGRYIVRLPVRPQFQNDLGESRKASINRLHAMERKFSKDSQLQSRYFAFMNDYQRLNHMRPVVSEFPNQPVNYLPHHAVFKETSSTTKLRVVFDASSKTSSGYSLNELLYTGQKLQQELFFVMLRWRMHAVVFTTDIEKMFRQICVDERDVDLQRIVWRTAPTECERNYQLLTVSYGTVCAPFLALRTLKQLAHDESNRFPDASRCLSENCYVDDILAGSNDIESCMALQKQLVGLLHSGGFNLKKWSSNREELLQHLPTDDIENQAFVIEDKTSVTTLGIRWYPGMDTFGFVISMGECSLPLTKRNILSEISKLFDPLGWLAPIVIQGKIIMQKLWVAGVSWDEPLTSSSLSDEFVKYRCGLATISQIHMPRWLGTNGHEQSIELHGFSDASIKAYSAAVYLRIVRDENVLTQLIAAKTKVAPVKQLSLPRLELCGAHLLACLVQQVRSALSLPNVKTFVWSDSTVVIAWVSNAPARWQVFVGNRVSKIQEVLRPSEWHHVPTDDNPADCASRGMDPVMLRQHRLWWHGPNWLQLDSSHWPNLRVERDTDLEIINVTAAIATMAPLMCFPNRIHQRFSSLRKLVRVLAFVRRFIGNIRAKIGTSVNRNRVTGQTLSTAEVAEALTVCVKIVQDNHFQSAIVSLRSDRELSKNSSLVRLRPIIDSDGVLRVGGRLWHADISYNEAHQIILPKNDEFTRLVIADAHANTLHGGTQLTLSHIRREYWILDGRNQVRYFINRCLKCFRFNAKAAEQVMGNLPAARVWPARPFLNAGIDYAGPVDVRTSKGRGQKSHKAYIAVFVCFTTRAVHLELVSDLTSLAFIAAYARFTSRRSICAHLHSDQGTTFVGANSELRVLLQAAISEHDKEIGDVLAKNGTQWHFNPPHAPHHGGLWEAAVKSTKHHLKRVIGSHKLTFEEMSTVLATIEACLNSRPIWPMSDDPSDICALTPGHFLIGAPLRTIPHPNLTDCKVHQVTRWKLLEKIRQDFWARWSREYLHSLQQRCKWNRLKPSVQVGDLVLVRDDRLPPGTWPMARVVLCHPGTDGHTRVVTLKGANGTFQRPIVKVCVLPVDTSSTDQPIPVATD